MRKLLLLLVAFFLPLALSAKEFAWFCAVEWTEKKPEWVFVNENVRLQNDGTYRIFVKWEFADTKKIAKQVWLISADFDKTIVVSSVGYDKDDKVEYREEYPYGEDWSYVLPETYAEAVIETTKEILIKK